MFWGGWGTDGEDDEVTPPRTEPTRATEMSLSDRVEPPECSRCKRPNAEYRVYGDACCQFCLTLWEKIKKFNQGIFDD